MGFYLLTTIADTDILVVWPCDRPNNNTLTRERDDSGPRRFHEQPEAGDDYAVTTPARSTSGPLHAP